MNDEQQERVLESLRLIREDCRADAAGLDGLALTGLTVGKNFGNLYAMVDALARTLEGVLQPETEAANA